MTDRDKLSDYLCPIGSGTMMCNTTCADALDACDAVTCSWLPIYRELIALREAVLGDMTPEEAAYAYRSIAPEAWRHPFLRNGQHFNALANMVERL